MGIHRTSVAGVIMALLLLGGAPAAEAISSGSRTGAPEISLDLTATEQPNGVAVRYTVTDMPHNTRVVLERRDTPKGRYRPVDDALTTSGELIDSDPVDRPATYRVVLEGPRGFALVTKEAGHVG